VALVILNQEEGINANIIKSMLVDEFLCQLALHWCKYELAPGVTLDNEIDGAIAEIANTIKNHYMPFVHRTCKHNSDLNSLQSKSG